MLVKMMIIINSPLSCPLKMSYLEWNITNVCLLYFQTLRQHIIKCRFRVSKTMSCAEMPKKMKEKCDKFNSSQII